PRSRANHRIAPPKLSKRRRKICCDNSESITLTEEKRAEFGLANPSCTIQHGLKHWLQFAGRRTDDAQHFRRRRLLVERFAQFVQQPRVLDGDDRLGGEVRYKRDLLFSKWCHLLAINSDCTYELIVLEHRNNEQCTRTTELNGSDCQRIAVKV